MGRLQFVENSAECSKVATLCGPPPPGCSNSVLVQNGSNSDCVCTRSQKDIKYLFPNTTTISANASKKPIIFCAKPDVHRLDNSYGSYLPVQTPSMLHAALDYPRGIVSGPRTSGAEGLLKNAKLHYNGRDPFALAQYFSTYSKLVQKYLRQPGGQSQLATLDSQKPYENVSWHSQSISPF